MDLLTDKLFMDMKKHFYLIAFLMLGLSACSDDEPGNGRNGTIREVNWEPRSTHLPLLLKTLRRLLMPMPQ